jgi:type I restriction enzyme R subunit
MIKVDQETKFKDPNGPFQIVIVRDMWLTGFDAPGLHTMYTDKPMQGTASCRPSPA